MFQVSEPDASSKRSSLRSQQVQTRSLTSLRAWFSKFCKSAGAKMLFDIFESLVFLVRLSAIRAQGQDWEPWEVTRLRLLIR